MPRPGAGHQRSLASEVRCHCNLLRGGSHGMALRTDDDLAPRVEHEAGGLQVHRSGLTKAPVRSATAPASAPNPTAWLRTQRRAINRAAQPLPRLGRAPTGGEVRPPGGCGRGLRPRAAVDWTTPGSLEAVTSGKVGAHVITEAASRRAAGTRCGNVVQLCLWFEPEKIDRKTGAQSHPGRQHRLEFAMPLDRRHRPFRRMKRSSRTDRGPSSLRHRLPQVGCP